MLPFNATAALAGQLLGSAFAAGLNLYATVAVLGTAARIGLIPPLPPGLRGLSNALVIGSAAALFIAELVMEKLPVVGAVWAAAHTVIRPVAAGLLTLLAFAGQPLTTSLGAATAVALVAFAAHGANTGLRVILASASRQRGALHIAGAALLLDLLAIATALAALLNPTAATLVGGGATLFLLLAGPRLWRAATFGARAFRARIAGFFGRAGWTERSALPRRIRTAVAAPALGKGEPRAVRAAAVGLPGTAAYRTGWLVFDPEAGPAFVYGRIVAPRLVPLPEPGSLEVRPGPVVDSVRATSGDRTFTLFLLKDGPPTDHTVAELAATRPRRDTFNNC